MMEPWQRELLQKIETKAYEPYDGYAHRLLGCIGDAVHHVLGHTEEEWEQHLETCLRPCSEVFGLAEPMPPRPSVGDVWVTIDKLRYLKTAGVYSGRQIRRFAHPPIPEDWDLFAAGQGGADRLVGDGDTVAIEDGQHFYTAPRFINAG